MRLKLITYLTPSNDIVCVYSDRYFNLKIGDYNGYNWKVLNILYLYNGKFISKEKLKKIKNSKKITKKEKIKEIIKIIKQK